jgi:hypothetical protein
MFSSLPLGGCMILSAALVAAAVADPGAQPAPAGVMVVPVASHTDTRLVYRTVVEPAAVVDRALAQQPVMTHLVEVRIVNTTTFLDPAEDYSVKHFAGRGVSRTGHTTLARIQQQHAGRTAAPAQVVRPAPTPQAPAQPIRPTMIFMRRPHLHEPEPAPQPPIRLIHRMPQVANATTDGH